MRHTSICRGTSIVKTHVSGVYTISMYSTSRRCMMRSLVFGLKCHVGAFFFSATLNSQQYYDNILYPFIVQLKEDEIGKAYLQQDDATTHTAHMSTALLDYVFVDRVISKTIWPPRSLDLSLPDLFLWGAMKNSVYLNTPHTIDDWKMAIKEYIQNVDHAMLNTVFKNTVRRVNKCLETGGGHFEHYL